MTGDMRGVGTVTVEGGFVRGLEQGVCEAIGLGDCEGDADEGLEFERNMCSFFWTME